VKEIRGGAVIDLHVDTIAGTMRLDVGFGEDRR
jgi:hypothetical protein